MSADVSDDDMRTFLADRLVRYKIPRTFEFTREPVRDDAGKVRRCFTEDIVAKFDDRPLVRGLDALMDNFFVFKAQQSGDWKITTHFMGNLNFNALESDVAETETNAIAFLVLPGGIGTLEEFFETWTWRQLGLHAKPIVLLNAFDYYTPLLEFLAAGAQAGFIRAEHRDHIRVANTVAEALNLLNEPN